MKTKIGTAKARSLLTLLLAAILTGCGSSKSYLVSEGFAERLPSVRKIGVVVADAEIYRLQAGGGMQPDAESSNLTRQGLENAAAEEFAGRGYVVVGLPVDDEVRTLLREYQQVRGAILKPFSSNQGRIAGLSALPAATRVASREGLDAIVVVSGRDHVSTGGRQAMMGALALVGIGAGRGIAYADLAVIDESGVIDFYDRKSGSNYNLTHRRDIGKVCAELVNDYAKADPASR